MYGPPMLPAALTTPAAEIADKLGAAGQTLAVAESSAGGLISASLLSVAGASRYYRGGFVTYTHDGTRAVLADAADLEPGDRGACEPFARFLASAARGKLSADWSVSETGASGPTGNRYGDPPGHAWVAVAGPDGLLRTEHILTGSDDRPANMALFAAAALGLLLSTLT
jgi:nicotinamide-nucleotide amidase